MSRGAATKAGAAGWKGNKSALPSKPCAVCGREMTWRRAWAKNWAEVKHCSDACRRRAPRPAAAPAGGVGG